MTEFHNSPELLTAKKAATLAKVHPRTVHKWVKSGGLRTVQRQPLVLIDRQDLDQFLDQRMASMQTPKSHKPVPHGDGASRLLTAQEAADQAQMDVSTVRKWVRQGNLHAVQRQPVVLIDAEDFQQFLSQRSPQEVSPKPATETDGAGAPAQGDLAFIDTLPTPQTHEGATWRALVLVLQRELEASRAREARLLDLLDQTTKPPASPRRRIVVEMTLVHRIREHLEKAGRPLRAWQIQKALNLDKPPYRDLSRLVARGEIQRISEGIYAAVDLSE